MEKKEKGLRGREILKVPSTLSDAEEGSHAAEHEQLGAGEKNIRRRKPTTSAKEKTLRGKDH